MIDLSRRDVMRLAAGVGFSGWSRLYAFSSDFWNKKEPSEWSSAEIEELTRKSPWAKEVSAQFSEPRDQRDQSGDPRTDPDWGQGGPAGPGGGMGRPGGMGIPGIGGGVPGMGVPGMGGPGMGGGRNRGGQQPAQLVRGIIRWESAKPILEATKAELPKDFARHYAISVSGFPLNPGSRNRSMDSDTSSQSTADTLERLKSLTTLEPKTRAGAQPGVVQQQPGHNGSVWFGFSKEILGIKPEDKELIFTTQFGRTLIRTKFNLKDMMYRGELAL